MVNSNRYGQRASRVTRTAPGGSGGGRGGRAGPAAGGGGFEEPRKPRPEKPKTMHRSRGQLATVYAPGALFTWEGGIGACMSVPLRNDPADIDGITQQRIYEQIAEFIMSWRQRATAAENLNHEVRIEQTVDRRVISNGELRLGQDSFSFVKATRMGFVPFPLAFACRRCGFHRKCTDVNRAEEEAMNFRRACPEPGGPGACADDWEQIDVVQVHWSGAVEPLTPETRMWDHARTVVSFDACETCGEKRFRLKRPTASFSDWYFECVSCKTWRQILQKDDYTLRLIGPGIETGATRQVEVNMEPVSYRASAAFYPQADRILVYRDSTHLDKLRHGSEAELHRFLGERYGYPGADLDDAERERLLQKLERGHEWTDYQNNKALLDMIAPNPQFPQAQKDSLRATISRWEGIWEKEVFTNRDRGSPALRARVDERMNYVRRFDPIRLAVEHKTLEDGTLLSNLTVGGKPLSVDLAVPESDPFLLPDQVRNDAQALRSMQTEVRRRLDYLGIERMRLIRELDVCEFTFGFTRTESGPIVVRDKNGRVAMPVRLNLFDRPGEAGHPVYCIKQANEAFYVKLKEDAVLRWLAANGMAVDLGNPAIRLGGKLIEDFPHLSFTRFLDDYRLPQRSPRAAYPYVFTLIHTIAHQMIEVMSELSGLDLGSFSEHLFVPDLAFIIYRRGTTMDLGNLSSMWRNYGNRETGNTVLNRLVERESLRCGSESVCMRKGGACPDCVLIPETSCVTRNELLSRSVLVGRGVPTWDQDTRSLVGFYDVVAEMAWTSPRGVEG
ncbi:hypothetical protein M0638_22920 [Roseomonas sp. NAR14]|uniref:Uncharacterized protein n=1 Tax=Roseomonas acroporae TaxID=2937791 RepID=A0A9X2BZN0_9PROT|nr:hypothetical protein [Roseomonas acroporae]MCK8787230.1 hypothetical protein [Roseomonas acroporae]